MEKQPESGYRDELAGKLREARNIGNEGKKLAKDLLGYEKQTDEYASSEHKHKQKNIHKKIDALREQITTKRREKPEGIYSKETNVDAAETIAVGTTRILGFGHDESYQVPFALNAFRINQTVYLVPMYNGTDEHQNQVYGWIETGVSDSDFSEEIVRQVTDAITRMREAGVSRVLFASHRDEIQTPFIIDGTFNPYKEKKELLNKIINPTGPIS